MFAGRNHHEVIKHSTNMHFEVIELISNKELNEALDLKACFHAECNALTGVNNEE